MRFPKKIRRPLEHYAERELRFHLVFGSHPEVGEFGGPFRDAAWQAVLDERERGRVELFAACLMPDHLHLLVRPDAVDVIRFVDAWKSWTTRLAWDHGYRGAVWQPGMWDRTVRSPEDFDRTVEYIVANPVAAGLVERVEEWPWTWAYYME